MDDWTSVGRIEPAAGDDWGSVGTLAAQDEWSAIGQPAQVAPPPARLPLAQLDEGVATVDGPPPAPVADPAARRGDATIRLPGAAPQQVAMDGAGITPAQVQDVWQARLNAAPRGAIQATGQIVSGAAEALAGASPQETARSRLTVLDAIDAGKVLPAAQDPDQLQQLPPDQRAALRSTAEAALTSGYVPPGRRAINAVADAGKALSDFGQRQFPVAPENERDLGVMVTGGMGSFAPLLAASAAGPLGLPAAAVAAGAQSYDATYRSALEQNPQRPDLAHKAASLSGLVGAGVMTVPVARFMSAAESLTGAPIAQAAMRMAGEGVTFTGIAQAQKLADNVIAAGTFDPGRAATKGLGDPLEMAATTLTGAAMPAAMHTPGVIRRGLEAATAPMMDPALRNGADTVTEAASQANATRPITSADLPDTPIDTGQGPSGDPINQNLPGGPRAMPRSAEVGRDEAPTASGNDNAAQGEPRPIPYRSAMSQSDMSTSDWFPANDRLRKMGYDADEIASMAPSVRAAIAPDDGAAGSTVPIVGDTFEQRAGGVVARLQADLGLTKEQAAGAVGNLGRESGLQAINERQPVGGRGGFGWAQWTGSRREEFEQFARARGMSPADPETNYQFLVHELTGSESGALAKLRQADSINEATRVFQDAYERPGIKATSNRIAMARKAYSADTPLDPGPSPADAPSGQPQRMFAGDLGIDTTPMLMELSDLVASHDADGRPNPAYPHDDGIQPRDRSTAGSQAQVRDIAANLRPELLMPGPDASGGAPIVAPDGRTVENGNGRVAALSLAYNDPALEQRGAEYRAHLDASGFDTTGMAQPVLVSRRDTPLAPDVRQQFIRATADRATLAMTAAERARTDASQAGSAIDLWQGQNAGSVANAPFVRAFMQGVPAAERGALINRDGSLSAAGEKRVQSAVTAHAYGDELGSTLDRFAGDEAPGMKAISGALTDAAGPWAQMRAEAARGDIPPALDITPDLAHAVQLVDQARQARRPVSELIGQADFDRPISPMTEQIVRGLFNDPALRRPVGRERVSAFLRSYAEQAMKAVPGPDMFGSPPADAASLMQAASLRAERGGAPRLLAARDQRVAHAATMADGDARTLTADAIAARDRLRMAAQAMMRFMGLPEQVGLKLVDRIVAGAHGADGAYTHGLIELALDTAPVDLPRKLMHESVHALMDSRLGLLTDGQRNLLLRSADRWLGQGENGAKLRELYGDDSALIREEAVARLGEEAFARGMRDMGPARIGYERMLGTVRGLGRMLRGQGFRTADDVFRGVLTGERALPSSREALAQFSPVILGSAAAVEPAQPGSDAASQPAKPGLARSTRADGATAAAIRDYGSAPERYLSLRDKPPIAELTGREIETPAAGDRRRAVQQWAFQNLRNQKVQSAALGANVSIGRRGIDKALSQAHDDVLSAFPAIPSLIENGERVAGPTPPRSRPDRPADTATKAWHVIGGNVRIGGRDVPMLVHVREATDGRYFYDLGIEGKPGANLEVGTDPRAISGGSFPVADPLNSGDPGGRPNPPSVESTHGPEIEADHPDRKFAKRARDDGPMLWDKAGLERAGQGVIPGAERDEAGALQRQADAPLEAKATQKRVDDLPLFAGETKQGRMFGLRDNVAVALRDGSAEPRRKLTAMLNQALFPMRAGSQAAQVVASKFANALRGIDFRYGQIDRQLVREFKPEERAAMGRALDAQSVFEQRIRAGEASEVDRAAFDAGKSGLAGLPDRQRQTVESLNELAKQTWQRLADRKLVEPGAEGLPYYMPRQFVMMDSLAGARRITAADNQLEGGKGGSGGGGLTAMDKVGGNLTTSGPKVREHLTPEESEAAARAKFGDNVHLVTDVRSLLDALRRQEQSVAGRDLVDAIKRIGAESGVEMVREGDAVQPRGFFTLDHPSLRTVGPTGEVDAAGKPIYGRTSLHIDEQFRGPLDAVLSKPTPDWYKAIMAVKSRSMTAIMFSPAMHLMVEVGRSLPVYHGNPFALISSMHRAGSVLKDRAMMDQAVADGLAPIGAGFNRLEATSIANEAVRLPATSLAGRIWGGDTKPQRAWHAFHQKALWDNILRLQTGIYNDMRARYVDKGFSPKAAGIMAAHLANRYAGALPPEQLSRAANMAANVSMFSRSFTLGNLAVMKDMLNGAPSHVRAALDAQLGGEGADRAVKALRRKAIGAFIMDVGMFYAVNALAQSGFSLARNMWNGDDLGTAASKEWQAYVAHGLPQMGNEPGKGDRVYLGNDSTGTGIYGRMPFGKVGEDFLGWMPVIGHPGTMIQAKMSPLLRSTWEAVSGRDSLGRSLYNPSPNGIADHLKIAGQAVMHIAASMTPADFVGQVYEAATGQSRGDGAVTAGRILGPMAGLSISHGLPGGPQAGVEHAAMEHDQFEQTQARSAARRLYALGREDEARAVLERAYPTNARGAANAWRGLVVPERAQNRIDRTFARTASPEARERVVSVNGARQ